jgi:nitrite reductase/ring-hydroxylating ferredoxin subunit/uncharacterized membrane protein
MRSKAHLSSHPIHPMLIPFPFAFLSGACAADVTAAVSRGSDWARIGSVLSKAGILTGFVAAAAGLADYVYTVPPNSSGKRRATQHLVVNASALSLFLAAAAGRRRSRKPLPLWGILAEAAGFGLLSVGGWLGGTLVYRNQIGVDHRYAGAGRWSETSVTAAPGEAVAVAREDELQVDQMRLLRVNGERVVLARTESAWAAFADRCTHKGGSLAGGVMACNTVTCPWHGSQFDVTTGEVKAGPADERVRTYDVEVAGGEVRIRVPAGRALTAG